MQKSVDKRAPTNAEGVAVVADADRPAAAAPVRVATAKASGRVAASELTIRAMTPADVPEVAELETRVFPDPWSVDSFLAEVERRPDIGAPLVVRDRDGELVAYAVVWFIVDEVHVGNIAVSPARQGEGVGSLVLRHVMDEGRRRGFMSTTLEVRPSNTPALRLYERFGFRRIAVRTKYYRNNDEDALVLAAPLGNARAEARPRKLRG